MNAESTISGKYFNLEELEDKESTTTELFLGEDSTVTMGLTDGPIPKESSGSWEIKDDGSVLVKLSRQFVAGSEGEETSVGEFSYQVMRTFTGELEMVGAKTVVDGVILEVDETLGDFQVGFFNMIDTTEERKTEGWEFEGKDRVASSN